MYIYTYVYIYTDRPRESQEMGAVLLRGIGNFSLNLMHSKNTRGGT